MKSVVCIFAHPDDEAFGPGGTIALLAKEHDVYVVCVTNGDAGLNSSNEIRDLGEIRREELLRSTNILGVREVYFLGYSDGSLCNNLYHEIGEKIATILQNLHPDTLLTFDQRGVSGHIDHIAVSMITTFVFEKVSFVKKLMYYCVSEEYRALHEGYFIYFPPGYKRSEVQEVIDISSVWEQKIAGMREHKSQKHDAEKILARYEKMGTKEEYFLVREK
jgi:N-acetylglucosamine malate deacetylase 2